MFCTYCGQKINEGSSFCPCCGKKLHPKKENTNFSTVKSSVAAPKSNEVPVSSGRRNNQQVAQAKTQNNKKKSHWGLKLLLWLLACIIMTLGTICTLLYFEIADIPVVREIMTEIGIIQDSKSGEGTVKDSHEHIWMDATCTTSQTCEECGETEGSALGHSWSDATCTTPSTCLTCGEIGSAVLGHQWMDATYQEPQTCSVCGLTQGASLSSPWKRLPMETPTGIISVSSGGWSTYVLTNQGRVYAIGRNQDGQTNVSHWSDVVDISGGDRHIAVLHEDGTVDAIGRWEHGQCNVHSWVDIINVYAGTYCTAGICEDGTVRLAGQSPEVTFDVSDWTNIVQVDIADYFIVGLRTDGTVAYTGGNGHEGESDYHKNYYKYDRNGHKEEIEEWEDIIAIAAGSYHTLGLRSDGTVVATTPKEGEYPAACDVSGWKDIVAISAGDSFSVGLRRDGTVVVAGDFCDKDIITKWKDSIHTVESWTDVIQIEAFYNQIIGLTKDGHVVACGFNTHGQCETDDLHRKVFEST